MADSDWEQGAIGRTDIEEHGHVGGVESGAAFKRTEDANYTTIIDAAVAGTTYIGTAIPGSSAANAVWRVKRIVEAAGVTTIAWAGGTDSFANVWNNRASLSYS